MIKSFLLLNRGCNESSDIQTIFKALKYKITSYLLKKASKIIDGYSFSELMLEVPKDSEFKMIAKSNSSTKKVTEKLLKLINVEETFTDVQNLNKIIKNAYMENFFVKLPEECDGNCQMNARKIVKQYLLTKISLFSNGQESAGQYLAYFKDFITQKSYPTSNYFSRNKKINLANPPSNLEVTLNEFLVKILQNFTKQGMNNLNILDYPSLGSITDIDYTSYRPETEISNFGIYNSWKSQYPTKDFKKLYSEFAPNTLGKAWSNYLKNPKVDNFPIKHEDNYLNFSKNILKDLDSFVKIVYLSLPYNFNDTFMEDFSSIISDMRESTNFVNMYGFPNMIMKCSFGYKNHANACQFQPSLTSNGMCFNFNGKSVQNIWKNSPILNSFMKIEPTEFEKLKFVEGGSSEGEY